MKAAETSYEASDYINANSALEISSKPPPLWESPSRAHYRGKNVAMERNKTVAVRMSLTCVFSFVVGVAFDVEVEREFVQIGRSGR